MTSNNGKAVVIGGSMAGLLAARALSERFSEVTIVERDAIAGVTKPRKGVPHGRHTHGLLARGRDALEAFFPGLSEQAFAGGAERIDLASQALWFNHGCFLNDDPSGLIGVALTRPRLEALVRNRVSALGNVSIMENCEALAPTFDPARQRVIGLNVQHRGGAEQPVELAADLVVDASGRGSRSPAWLEAAGFARPREQNIKVDLGYMTAEYRRRPGQLPGRHCVVMAACAPDWRVGVLIGVEDDRWMVTLGGYFGDDAPADPAGFLAFARTLRKPEIHDTLKDAELLAPPTPYRFGANLRRRYDELSRFPEGYLVIGDALCSFNPIYGQGMTVACVEALALREALARGVDGVARRFFADASRIIDTPWDIAVGSDLQHPEVVGDRSPKVRFINWYIAKLYRAAQADAALTHKFLRVANLLEPPTSLLAPAVALRVLRGNLVGAPSPGPAPVPRALTPH